MDGEYPPGRCKTRWRESIGESYDDNDNDDEKRGLSFYRITTLSLVGGTICERTRIESGTKKKKGRIKKKCSFFLVRWGPRAYIVIRKIIGNET